MIHECSQNTVKPRSFGLFTSKRYDPYENSFSSDMLLQQKRKKKTEKKSKKHLQNSSVGKGRSNSGERKDKARQILIFFVSFKKFFIASTKKRLKNFFPDSRK